MPPSRKCKALITSFTSHVSTIRHSDRSTHQRVVISEVDGNLLIWKFICSVVMSLGNVKTTNDLIRKHCGIREGRHVMAHLLLLFWGSSLMAFGQRSNAGLVPADQPSRPAESPHSTIGNGHPDELKQELDAYAMELSRIPADPLTQWDHI